MSDVPAGWEGILDEGEEILWQGRPDPTFHVTGGGVLGALFGMVFSGFAFIWMWVASSSGGPFWMFGLIHFGAGLAIIGSTFFGPTWKRRHTWYTLSDRRAFVATDLPFKGRTLKSYPIGPATRIEYQKGALATINFAQEWRRGDKGRRYQVKIGFERLEDGDAVMRHIREAQRVDETKIQEGA